MGHTYTKNDWLFTLKFKFKCVSSTVSGKPMCEPHLQARFITWVAS